MNNKVRSLKGRLGDALERWCISEGTKVMFLLSLLSLFSALVLSRVRIQPQLSQRPIPIPLHTPSLPESPFLAHKTISIFSFYTSASFPKSTSSNNPKQCLIQNHMYPHPAQSALNLSRTRSPSSYQTLPLWLTSFSRHSSA